MQNPCAQRTFRAEQVGFRPTAGCERARPHLFSHDTVKTRSRRYRIGQYLFWSAKHAALWPVRAALRRYVRAQPHPDAVADADRRVFILLMSAWGLGGTIRSAHNLAGYLAKDYDVEILSVFRRRGEPFFPFPAGVKVTALDDQRPSSMRRKRLLRRFLRGISTALMDPVDKAAGVSNVLVDIRLARKLRGQSGFLIGTRPGLNMLAADLSPPGLITIGEEQMNVRSHTRRLRARIKRSYPKLDALAVLTERDTLEYEKLLGDGAREVRLVRIPNTVRELAGPKADLSAQVILAAGRLTPQKGFDMLIRAFARITSAHADWRLRICGKGDSRDKLQRLIDEQGVSDKVTLAGPRDMAEEMAQASVFVLSSRFEGFPLVLLEAMSKGMAVVSFDCPTGPGEVVDDHRNGILVPAKDVEGLANAMIEMIEDEDLRRRCAAAAIETAHSYTMEAIGPQWDALFTELAESRRAQASPEDSARVRTLDSAP